MLKIRVSTYEVQLFQGFQDVERSVTSYLTLNQGVQGSNP